MSPRARILAFGSCGAVTIAGGLCGWLVPGLAGQLLVFVLICLGLGGALLLVFLEVGLSEDRERAREQDLAARHAARAAGNKKRPRLQRPRSRRLRE